MRIPTKMRVMRGLLVAGVGLGFGSGIYRVAHRHRHHHADRLARVCVDAALGRAGPGEGRGEGRPERWVSERCAAHARATAP